MSKKPEMSEEEREWLGDAKTPTEPFDIDAYINGPRPVHGPQPSAPRHGGMIVPKMDFGPDPLADDWVARRIEQKLGAAAKSLNPEDRARMEAVRDPRSGPKARVVASLGRRGASLFRKFLVIFDGYGLKKIGPYDEPSDTIKIEITERIAKLMLELGFSLKLIT